MIFLRENPQNENNNIDLSKNSKNIIKLNQHGGF